MIMKRLLLLLAAILTCAAANSHAAISVGPSGSGVLTFDALPAVTEWSTLSVGSFSSRFSDAAALDAAVMASTTAAFVNVALSQSAIIPPSQNAIPRWTSAGLWLQTRPTGNDYTLLMATLRNDTGLLFF